MLDSIYADLLILAGVMLFAHWLHNRLNNYLSDALIVALGVVMAFYYVETGAQAFVFVLATILGYTIEFLGVYTGGWRYNTRSGYSNWTGMGWGLLILLIYKAELAAIGWPVLLALLAVSLVIVLRKVKNNNIRGWFDIVDFAVRGLALLIAPEIFVLAFALGIFVEYIGTEVCKTWVYPTIRYLNIGTGYSLLVVVALRMADYALGIREASVLPLLVIALVVLVYVMDVIRSLPPESRLRRWLPLPRPAIIAANTQAGD